MGFTATREELDELRKELQKKPIPFYFNFVGAREDLLERAVASVPKDICDVRVQRWEKPHPFTKSLNKILRECDSKLFFFMHYDATVQHPDILLAMVDEWRRRTRALQLRPGSERTPFVPACGVVDILILYDTEVMEDIGGWDEGFNNSWMELDMNNIAHQLCLPIPVIFPGKENIPGYLDHKDFSTLRDPDNPENIKSTYDITLPRDFEYYYRKWPPFDYMGSSREREGKGARLAYEEAREYVLRTHGACEDVAKNIDLKMHTEMVLELRQNYEYRRNKRWMKNQQQTLGELEDSTINNEDVQDAHGLLKLVDAIWDKNPQRKHEEVLKEAREIFAKLKPAKTSE